MKFSKRVNYLVIGFLAMLNIVFRYPTTPHETGADSFFIHNMASSISMHGCAKWFIHPLSPFGLYPFSYPSGGQFLLSGVSQSIGINMEYTILLVATLLGIFGAFTAYLLAKEIWNDDSFAFSVAVLFSMSRYFLGYTSWTFSTRGIAIAFLPLFIWSLLRCYNRKNERLKYGMLSLVLLIIIGTMHRMALFLSIVLVAYGISILVYMIIGQFAKREFKFSRAATLILFSLFTAFLIFLFLSSFTDWAIYNPALKYEIVESQKYFFKGSGILIGALNTGAEYAMSFGILIVLAPIGYFSVMLKKRKKQQDIFLLAFLFLFAPLLLDFNYMMTFVIIAISLFAGMGLMWLVKGLRKLKIRRSVIFSILMMLLVFSVSLPSFIVVRHIEQPPGFSGFMTEETYDAACFVKNYGSNITRMTNDKGHIITRINAVSQYPIYKDIDYFNHSSVKPVSLSKFLAEKYKYLYISKNPPRYPSIYWSVYVSGKECDDPYIKQVLNYTFHGEKTYYVILNDYYPDKVYSREHNRFIVSRFFVSVQEKRYEIYDNGLESIWYLKYA